MLNASLDPTLKLQLIQNKNDDNFENLQETAYLMEDMLRALELGRIDLTPRAKLRVYNSRAPKNPIEIAKYVE